MGRTRRFMSDTGYLKCTGCLAWKHISDFYQNKKKPWATIDGVEYGTPQSMCKLCRKFDEGKKVVGNVCTTDYLDDQRADWEEWNSYDPNERIVVMECCGCNRLRPITEFDPANITEYVYFLARHGTDPDQHLHPGRGHDGKVAIRMPQCLECTAIMDLAEAAELVEEAKSRRTEPMTDEEIMELVRENQRRINEQTGDNPNGEDGPRAK